MDEFFCRFGEIADKLTANPWFLALFNTALVALWVLFGTDMANIFISIVTAESVLITAGATRRGQKAIHAKLDELISASEARDDLLHIEERSEEEIDEIKV